LQNKAVIILIKGDPELKRSAYVIDLTSLTPHACNVKTGVTSRLATSRQLWLDLLTAEDKEVITIGP
jgi:hypothetical protein